MTINILNEVAISKLIAFLSANATGVFHIRPELLAEVQRRVEAFARENHVRITLCEPNNVQKQLWAGGGVLAGALLGLKLAGLYGAGIGAIAGAATGYGCAHMRVIVKARTAISDSFIVLKLEKA